MVLPRRSYTLRPRTQLTSTCFQCQGAIPAEAKGISGCIEPRDEKCLHCGASTLQDYYYDEAIEPVSQAESQECATDSCSSEDELPLPEDLEFIVREDIVDSEDEEQIEILPLFTSPADGYGRL
jgi:hypothetical protein